MYKETESNSSDYSVSGLYENISYPSTIRINPWISQKLLLLILLTLTNYGTIRTKYFGRTEKILQSTDVQVS